MKKPLGNHQNINQSVRQKIEDIIRRVEKKSSQKWWGDNLKSNFVKSQQIKSKIDRFTNSENNICRKFDIDLNKFSKLESTQEEEDKEILKLKGEVKRLNQKLEEEKVKNESDQSTERENEMKHTNNKYSDENLKGIVNKEDGDKVVEIENIQSKDKGSQAIDNQSQNVKRDSLSKDNEVLEYLYSMGLNEEGSALIKHQFSKIRSNTEIMKKDKDLMSRFFYLQIENQTLIKNSEDYRLEIERLNSMNEDLEGKVEDKYLRTQIVNISINSDKNKTLKEGKSFDCINLLNPNLEMQDDSSGSNRYISGCNSRNSGSNSSLKISKNYNQKQKSKSSAKKLLLKEKEDIRIMIQKLNRKKEEVNILQNKIKSHYFDK